LITRQLDHEPASAGAQATVGLSLPAISRFGLMQEAELRETKRTQGLGVSHAHRGAARLVTLYRHLPALEQAVIPLPGLLTGSSPLNLTLDDWLSMIPFGTDYLTSVTDARLFGLGDLGEGAEKGKKVDLARGKGKPRMIVEFRTGSPMGFRTPSQWPDFSFDYFSLASRDSSKSV
jgi:hypothetical protein